MANYIQIIDEIEIDVDSEPLPVLRPASLMNPGGYLRGRVVLLQSWPNVVGVMLLVTGFITSVLGALEVFPIPALLATDISFIGLHRGNCFGASLWCGIMMILTGSLALQAVFTKKIESVRRFYNMAVFALLVHLGFLILQLYAGSRYWVPYLYTQTKHTEHESDVQQALDKELEKFYGFAVLHLIAGCFSLVGLMLLAGLVSRYFDSVLCGEVQLLKSLSICCCPCCFLKKSRSLTSIQSSSSDDSNLII